MRWLRKAFLVGGLAVLLSGATAAVSYAQIRQQSELLRRLWPFGRQQQPVPLLPESSIPTDEDGQRPLIAPFVRSKIDINTATLPQLQSLPGVNPSMGTRLFVGRPYRNYQDLQRDGIPLNVVQGLRGKITFGP